MADIGDIRSGMQVIGSDGGMVGRVTGLHRDHLHVEPDAPEPGPGFFAVPRRWIVRVDEHVHLDRAAALVRDTWKHETSLPADAVTAEASGRGKTWPWTIGALLVLLVLYFIFAD